ILRLLPVLRLPPRKPTLRCPAASILFKGAEPPFPVFRSLERVMERREAPGVCETPWELARLPGEPSGPPPGTRSPSDVGPAPPGAPPQGAAHLRQPACCGPVSAGDAS